MKKGLFKTVLAATLTLITLFTAGCFGKQVGPAANGRKKIFISVYNGGLGTEWIKPAIQQFEADYPDYYIELEEKKRTLGEITSFVALGVQADMYFSTVADFQELIYKDQAADLSAVLDLKPDGENGMTVGEKMLDLDLWKQIASKDGKGIYMLPLDDSALGFVYDHGKFVESGLLINAENNSQVKSDLATQGISFEEEGENLVFKSATHSVNYKDGDIILRAGRDGKYGTYDDGQPITMAEWNRMMNVLKGMGKAIIYAGKILDYTTDIFNGIYATYDGVDAWNTHFNYQGSYTFEGDSEPTEIPFTEGYKVFGMTGIKKSLEFLNDYLNNHEYVHDGAFMSEEWHTDAQGHYVIGGAKDSADAPFTGMLVDGVWWENEARSVFNGLSKDARYKDYAYGTRDYRFMLFPDLEGSKGAFGNGKGVALSVRSTGSSIVLSTDPDIIEKCGIFYSYTVKEQNLKYFTQTSGSIRPFKYTMTDEDLAGLTPFARNYYQMYFDKENIGLVRPQLDKYLTPITYKASMSADVNWITELNSIPYNIPITALRLAANSTNEEIKADPVGAVFKGYTSYYRKNWNQYMNELGVND